MNYILKFKLDRKKIPRALKGIKLSPEVLRYMESLINRVPGINNSTNYRLQGILALNYQEKKAEKEKQKAFSHSEMKPTVKREASFSEKLRGKQDEYTLTPQVIGMSGADPLGEFIVSSVGLGGLGAIGKTGLWNVAKYAPKTLLGNWSRGYFINKEMKLVNPLELVTLTPIVRNRVGDVEINNPLLAYRQGNNIAENFLKTNKVSVPEGDYAKKTFTTESGRTFEFGKTFQNPMFALGRLWYGVPEASSKGDLLVTSEPLALATKSSAKVKSPVNGTLDVRNAGFDNRTIGSRRVMNTPDQLNTSNTSAYTWQPGYGYKKILLEPSIILFPLLNNGIPVSYGSQPVPIRWLILLAKINSPMTRQQKIDYLKTQLELALKVDRARDFDAILLTKGRLKNGGFDRLIYNLTHRMKGENIDYLGYFLLLPFNNQLRNISILLKILKSHPYNLFTNQEWNKILKRTDLVPEHGGIGSPLQFYGWFKNTNHLNKRNIGAAHEFSHYVYHPYYTPEGLNFSPEVQNYFMKHGATEILARGTQLKNYFGLKESEEITPEMWDYASKHYIKDTGLNNNMVDLFNSINTKSKDFPLFLKWLNKHSLKQGGKL